MSTSWSRSLPLSGSDSPSGTAAIFDNREKAFEIKFARDEELKFRATARRNKLMGLWAAHKLGLGECEAAEYARSVVFADLSRVGGRDAAAKVKADLAAAGASVTDEDMLLAARECAALAELELRAEA